MNSFLLPKNLREKDEHGNYGVWWHENNPGPLKKLPFIKQFGSMKFSKVRIDDSMRPHLNDGIEIHYVNSGKYDWVIEGKAIELFPENLSVTAPWHENGSISGIMDIGQINWIIIKPQEFTNEKALNFGNWSKLPVAFQENLGKMIGDADNSVIEKARNFKKYFDELRNELAYQEEGFEIKVQNILENLFIDLHRQLSNKIHKNQESDTFIEKLTQLLESDLTKKWHIEDLAAVFNMGKTKFTYEVKKLTGFPPNSFIISLKLEKAIQLLKTSPSISMAEIAFSCGFSSLQHFTSTFSQRNGISPRKYQLQQQKKKK
ncbi:AraC family transcriptional regulator [Flavobacterium sp. L1I52]|uniref:AraC family transcriptional regulator n=1 Tax=Flavobacterium pokkalii TaxID=1940408 RepID=A0ABR7UQP4_9FLAO|nr:AraC family transcriptional regulator [Flavobacterium pokkalii]MBD0725186.1 AraC family transcriptional regulator [Flavobacterium pokkalii]